MAVRGGHRTTRVRERFYCVDVSFRAHGLICDDEAVLTEGPYKLLRQGETDLGLGRRAGLPNFPYPPPLVYKSAIGPPPQDVIDLGACWAATDRFKRFVEEFDPGAFEFGPCDNGRLKIGEQRPIYWVCALKRWGDFLDEERSENLFMREEAPGWRVFIRSSDTRIAVKRSALGDGHVFGVPESVAVFCDQAFKDAYKAAKFGPLLFEPT